MNAKVKKAIRAVLAVIMAVLLFVINFLSYKFYDTITRFTTTMLFGSTSAIGVSSEDAFNDANDIINETMSEGIVLLKNNGSLPLAASDAKIKVNLFGYDSYNPIYSSVGSASAFGDGNITYTTFKDALENDGFEVNQELYDFYGSFDERKNGNIFDLLVDYAIYEPGMSEYDATTLENAKNYSDTAIVFFGRSGGEGHDLPTDMDGEYGGEAGRSYLELQPAEEELMDYVCDNYETVIVIINTTNNIELGFLDDDRVDAALWIGNPGSVGSSQIPRVLKGEVNPSGHLVDTYPYEQEANPTYYTMGENLYTNFDDYKYTDSDLNKGYMHYYEGIYVGYRYFETRFIGDDNVYTPEEEAAYQAVVQYPFGYGLSYTTFDWSADNWKVDGKGGKVSVDVTVTNTGSMAGKDVVQLYYTAPYTPGGIEKSAVVLGGFAKTKLLNPGESDTVTITMDYDDLSSYDYVTEKAYVLDSGDYILSLRTDAHTVKGNDEMTYTFNVPETIVYNEENGARSSDKQAATNEFDNINDDGNMTYVSRADWEGTLPTVPDSQKQVALADKYVQKLKDGSYGAYIDFSDDDTLYSGAAYKTDAKNGVTVDDVVGKDFDDPIWDDLLDNLTLQELMDIPAKGGYGTIALDSIGKNAAVDADGPIGLNSYMTSEFGNEYCSEAVMASTWNVDLMERIGKSMATEWLSYGIVGMYAPAVNTHRSPFGGRQSEYFSEDGVLAGKMAAAQIKGIHSLGCYVYVKHFALNDQEINRAGIMNWANEQAVREIYLRPFEIAVKEGNADGMMTSMSRLGTTFAGSYYELLTAVPRGEWGFQGVYVTDGNAESYWYSDPDTMVRAGCDLNLNMRPDNIYVTSKTTDSNYGMECLRAIAKRVIYRHVNSIAPQAVRSWTPYWMILLAVIDLALAYGVIINSIRFFRGEKQKKKKADIKESKA